MLVSGIVGVAGIALEGDRKFCGMRGCEQFFFDCPSITCILMSNSCTVFFKPVLWNYVIFTSTLSMFALKLICSKSTEQNVKTVANLQCS